MLKSLTTLLISILSHLNRSVYFLGYKIIFRIIFELKKNVFSFTKNGKTVIDSTVKPTPPRYELPFKKMGLDKRLY